MAKSNITISVLGLGRFGTLVASILSKHFDVCIYHYKDNEEIRQTAEKTGAKLVDLKTAAKCDIVILTVPIVKTREVLGQIANLVNPGALVLDTCSVKVEPVKWLREIMPEEVEVMGMHPMFGPVTTKFDIEKQTYSLAGKQIVLCPIRINEEKLKAIKLFLTNLNLDVIETTPEDHDEQNARTLSFVHFLGRALNRAGIKEQRIFTPGYADLLKISPHTNSDNWQLFFDMHNFNPYSDKVREKFFSACAELEEKIIESGATDSFDFNRKMIDKTDKEIMRLLEKRFKYAAEIGKIKKAKGMEIVDPKREEDIIKNKQAMSDLDPEFIEKLFRLIFSESYKKQL